MVPLRFMPTLFSWWRGARAAEEGVAWVSRGSAAIRHASLSTVSPFRRDRLISGSSGRPKDRADTGSVGSVHQVARRGIRRIGFFHDEFGKILRALLAGGARAVSGNVLPGSL